MTYIPYIAVRKQLSPIELAFLATVLAGGLVAAVGSLRDISLLDERSVFKFGVLVVLALLGQLSADVSLRRESACLIVPAVVFTGLLMLPAPLLTALIAVAMIPSAMSNEQQTRPTLGYLISISLLLLVAHLTQVLLAHAEAALPLPDQMGLARAFGAVVVFLLLGSLGTAVWLSLDRGLGWTRSYLVGRRQTLATVLSLIAIGIVVADMSRYSIVPLLFTLPPILYLGHWLQRSQWLHRAVMNDQHVLSTTSYLDGVVTREVRRAQRYGRQLALILIDLDQPRAGGRWRSLSSVQLAEVQQVVEGILRDTDILIRASNEEFLVLLPESDEAAAEIVARRLLNALRSHRFGGAGADQTLDWVRIAVAAFPMHGSTADDLLHSADLALQRAGTEGRDQIQFAVRVEKRLADDSGTNPNKDDLTRPAETY